MADRSRELVAVIHYMDTYLLTWNPELYKWEDLADLSNQLSGDSAAETNWSFGNRKSAELGDRVFILKQGSKPPRGIVGSGFIVRLPFVDRHWDHSEKTANYVGVQWDRLLDPELDPILSRELLDDPEFAGMNWNTQSSGTQIPDEIARHLEIAWREFLSSIPRRNEKPVFGEVPGFPEGSSFGDRKALSNAYIHRPIQAGIWGRENEGAFSIVISGGYVDDKDFGDEIVYTGQGGRDPATRRQIFDQPLKYGNLALVKSSAEGLPVRVTRGAQHHSDYSPRSGYRYDGLYRVDQYWQEKGEDGFLIWRYRLVKIDQPSVSTGGFEDGRANRQEVVIQRIVRNSKICQEVKELYKYQCQVCGLSINTPGGPYAEGAHIRPLGLPHNGSDTIDNIICLCPNHHVMFDNFGFTLTDDLKLIGIARVFNVHPKHKISVENVRYHRKHLFLNTSI